jgi:glutamate-1-semialdehyde 2,1-aminomutase
MNVIEDAKVIHAGTMNSSNPTIAAALATIEVLEEEQPYERMFQYGQRLMEGIRQAAADARQNLLVQGPGPMFHTGFTDLDGVNDYRDTLSYDKSKLAQFISGMHDKGVRVIGRGLWYINAAHTKQDIDHAIQIARKVLLEMQ